MIKLYGHVWILNLNEIGRINLSKSQTLQELKRISCGENYYFYLRLMMIYHTIEIENRNLVFRVKNIYLNSKKWLQNVIRQKFFVVLRMFNYLIYSID